jgi:hypothetical protein
MYRCQITNKLSREGEKLNKIVAITRPKTYTNWDRETEEEWTSSGYEPALELDASEDGVKTWEGWSLEERESFLKGLNTRASLKSSGTRSSHKENSNF